MGLRLYKRSWIVTTAAATLLAATVFAGPAQAAAGQQQSLRSVTGEAAPATPRPRAPQGGGTFLDQAPNGVNGFFSDAACSLCGTGQQSIGENFVVPSSETIGTITFWGGYFSSDTPLTTDVIRVIIHSDAGGLPGAVVYDESNVSSSKAQTGVILFGVHEWEFTLTLAAPPTLAAGTYHLEIFNDTTAGVDDFFWETGNVDPTNGLVGSAFAFETPGVTWNPDTVNSLSLQLDPPSGPPPICSTPGVSIPDNDPTGVSDSIGLSGTTGPILDLNVYLGATHTFVGDLLATLTHDDTGTSVAFFDRPGVPLLGTFGCGGDNVDVTADDEGPDTPIETQCANLPAISGDAVGGDPPNNTQLSAFDGEDLAGSWTLNISDNAGADTGTLDMWCLVVDYDTMPFLDGFESGDTSHWSQVQP
jgi:Proprotein convertase P-domain